MGIEFLPVALLFVLLLGGMPVAFALGISGIIGTFSILGLSATLGAVATIPYRTTASFTIVSIGMFILMAEIATQSGITSRLFAAANSLVGHIRGGLGIATIFASAAFGTLSGSSVAAAATMARVAVPEMIARNYSKSFAAGTTSIAGTLAILIPPSIPLIIYGVITETSIGRLLIAGVVPGVVTVVAYVIVILIWARVSPQAAPRRPAAEGQADRWSEIKYVWPFFLIIVLIFAALYSGAVTTTEASALGASAVVLVWLVLSRVQAAGLAPFTVGGLGQAFDRALSSTVMIIVLLIGAYFFSFYLILTGATQEVGIYIEQLEWSPTAILLIVILLYLVLGMFMSQLEIMILTLPFVFPVLTGMGYDPIWLGIIVVKTIEIGLVTPPVGMNVFVVSSSSRAVTPIEGFVGVTPFLVAELVTLGILIAFPELATVLPSLMRGE